MSANERASLEPVDSTTSSRPLFDLERAEKLGVEMNQLLQVKKDLLEKLNQDDDDDDREAEKKALHEQLGSLENKLMFCFREILMSNGMGRNLLKHQLRHVLSLDQSVDPSNVFIYDPRSFAHLPLYETDKTSTQKVINVVVLLSGALNPVHRAHCKASLLGARAIEEQFGIPGNSAWSLGTSTHKAQAHDILKPGFVKVVGCALVPSSDTYVKGKLGAEALMCDVRCNLCDAACIEETKEYLLKACQYCLAVAKTLSKKKESGNDASLVDLQKFLVEEEKHLDPYVPLFTLPYNDASANRCCSLLHEQLVSTYPPHSNHDFCVLPLFGSDFALKCRNYGHMVCIARNDSQKSGQAVQRAVENGQARENFVFVPMCPENEVVFGGASHSSSTLVRKALQGRDRKTLLTMLHQHVMERMIFMTKSKCIGKRSKK